MDTGSDWNTYSYTFGEHGRRATVRFNVALATALAPPAHRTCVRLVVEGDEGSVLDAFEADLPGLLASLDALFAGVIAYGATREFVFQVHEEAAFRAHEPALVERAPGTARLIVSEGWDFFNDRVCPTEADWRRITDREAVQHELAAGADPGVAHPIRHTFYGDDGALSRLCTELTNLGGQVVRGPQRLVFVYPQVLDPETVSELTLMLARMGRTCGAGYDGWRLDRLMRM